MLTWSPPPPCPGGRSPPRRTPSVGARQSPFFQTLVSSSSSNKDAAENREEISSCFGAIVWLSSVEIQEIQSVGSDSHFPLPTYRPPHPWGQMFRCLSSLKKGIKGVLYLETKPWGQLLPLQVSAPSFSPATGPTTHLGHDISGEYREWIIK